VVARLLRRLRSERGFTVVETVVAAAVGSVVMLAIFILLDTSVKQSTSVTARVDSTQRGRAAMELITRELRSQVCWAPNATTPALSLASAGDYSVSFYAFNGSGTVLPDKRTIAWDTNTNSITETIEPGVGNPVTAFGTPRTRTLLTAVKAPAGNTPVFEYQRVDGTTLTGAPLSAANLAKTGVIVVRFSTSPTTRGSTKPPTSFESQVFIRTADPNGLGGSTDPDCT